ncbi:MAG: phosphotransferase [Verrucomicrobiales bacterium]|nr:phosphotransferase [Verrucomicrobiales bacterium]MCP5558883.1 phosphotransferase [Verrucomicrobiaceae bacterium]
MPPEQEALMILTCQRFPRLAGLPCAVDAIVKGGSDRHFYRLSWPDSSEPSMILMVYTLNRRDNPKFVPATHRLAALGVRVPTIHAFDEDRLCVWLQDLGKQDLHSLHQEPWDVRRPYYQAVLREAAKIHTVTETLLSAADLAELEPPFDEALYQWEQDYFLDHYVRGHLGRDFPGTDTTSIENALRDLRRTLGKMPRCLVHRDFQSQNVMLRGSETWLVDYQGLRLGLAEYDLASMLMDPYVTISRSERNELLTFYAAERKLDAKKLQDTFYLCAAQRLMQALGAYANLSRNLGKKSFQQHIPAAVKNLQMVCSESAALAPLAELLS